MVIWQQKRLVKTIFNFWLHMLNYYNFLNIREDSSESEIKLAYRKLAQKYHPDLYLGEDANQKMALLNEIKNILLNSVKRNEYDKQLSSFNDFLSRRERAERERAERERAERERAERERAKKKYYQSIFVLISIFMVLGIIFSIAIPNLEKSTPIPQDNVDQSEELVPPIPQDNVDQSGKLVPPIPQDNVDQSGDVIHFDVRIEKPLLQKALFDLKSIIEESGMAGAVVDISDCYENNPNKKYCFYLDYSARIFDAHMAQAFNTEAPTVPFFDEDTFLERSYSNYYIHTEARNSMKMTNDSLYTVGEIINEKMPDVFLNN